MKDLNTVIEKLEESAAPFDEACALLRKIREDHNPYIEQVGVLILGDDPDICVVSDLRQENGAMSFTTHNKRTDAKYRIDIKITEI